MKINLFVVLSFIILSISCKNEPHSLENADVNTDKTMTQTDTKNVVKFALSPKTKSAVENWEDYHQLVEIVNSIKLNDLSVLKNNNQNITTLFINLNNSIPEIVKTNATTARITAIKTKLYKLKSTANLSNAKKDDVNAAIQEFLESFSNLNFQMNKKLEKDQNYIQKPQ